MRRRTLLKTVGIAGFADLSIAGAAGETTVEAADRQRWSEPATWGGEKPGQGDIVEITEGMDVLLDESPPELAGISIDGGSLTFARRELSVTTGYIIVKHGGTLQIGTESQPFEQAATITLTGARSDIGTGAAPDESCGVKTICSMGGTLSIHGAVDQPTWTKLGATAAAGDTQITLTEAVDWSVGDELALVSTSLDPADVDRRTITSVDGTTVELDEPLDHTHYGQLQSFGPSDEYEVDERGEVLNLSRNVVIQGDEASEADNFGGHIMAMNEHHEEQMNRADSGEAWPDIWADYDNDPDLLPQIAGVELRRMGQEGILARYPFHWHRYGEADGSYIRDCAIHDSYQRGVTVHGAQNTTIENNVAFDVTGHCYFLEGKIEDGRPVDDFEQGTQLRGNVGALVTTFSSEERELIVSDAAPAVFWTNGPPKSTVVDNVAAGVYGHGFWVDLDNSAEESHRPRNNEDLGTWEGNVAHSIHSHDPSGTDGVTISQRANQSIPTDGGAGFMIDGGAGDFDDLTAYKSVVGFWSDESKNNAVRESVIADTRNALWFKDGGVDDSVVVAHTDNQTLETDAETQRGYTVPEPGNTRMGSGESITGLVSFYQGARTKNTVYIGFDTDDDVPHGVFGTMQNITHNPYFAAGNQLIDSNPYLPNLPKEGRELDILPRVIPTADGGIVGEYDDEFDISEFDGGEYRELRWGSGHLTDRESCEQIDYIGKRAGHEFDRYVYSSTARSVSVSYPPGDYAVDGSTYEAIGGKRGYLESGLTYRYQGTLSPEFDAGRIGQIRIHRGYPGDYVVFGFPMEAKPVLEQVGQPAAGDLVEVDSKAAVQAEEALDNTRYYWDGTENTLWLRVVANSDNANEFGTLPFRGNFGLPIKRSRDNGVYFDGLVDPGNQIQAAFSTTNESGTTVSFDAGESSVPEGSISSYEWAFGDGSTASGETVDHSYDSAGSYDVTLTVTDGDGSSAETTETVTVSPADGETVTVAPGGEHTFSPSSLTIEPGTTVLFVWEADNHTVSVTSQPDGGSWDGVDSTQSSGVTHTHTFETTGTYEYQCNVHPSMMQGTITVGEDTPTVSEAIDADDDGNIDDSELLTAVEHWQHDETVPGTDGETVDDQTLLELVERWQEGN